MSIFCIYISYIYSNKQYLTLSKELNYSLELVFNHDQKDFLDEIDMIDNSWSVKSTSIDFKNHSKMENQTLCFSNDYKNLLSFTGANEQCKEIINLICKDQKCKEIDIQKAPRIIIKMVKYEYEFFGKEYLYSTKDDQDKVTIHCRFEEPSGNENCIQNDIIVGKLFFNKYIPVFNFKTVKDNKDQIYKASLGFLPYFDTYKPNPNLKYAIIGVGVAIILVLIMIFLVNRMKKSTSEDYSEI